MAAISDARVPIHYSFEPLDNGTRDVKLYAADDMGRHCFLGTVATCKRKLLTRVKKPKNIIKITRSTIGASDIAYLKSFQLEQFQEIIDHLFSKRSREIAVKQLASDLCQLDVFNKLKDPALDPTVRQDIVEQHKILVSNFLKMQGIDMNRLEKAPIILSQNDANNWREKLISFYDSLEEISPPSNRAGYEATQHALSKLREYQSRIEAQFPEIIPVASLNFTCGDPLPCYYDHGITTFFNPYNYNGLITLEEKLLLFKNNPPPNRTSTFIEGAIKELENEIDAYKIGMENLEATTRGILDRSFAFGGIGYVLDGAKHGDIEKSIGMDNPIKIFNNSLKELAHKHFEKVEDALEILTSIVARLCNQMKISFVLALSMTLKIDDTFKSILLYEGDTSLYRLKRDGFMELLNGDRRKEDFKIRDPACSHVKVIDREPGDIIFGITDGADFISQKHLKEVFLEYLRTGENFFGILQEAIHKYNIDDHLTSPMGAPTFSGHEVEKFDPYNPLFSDDVAFFFSSYPSLTMTSSPSS